MFHNNHLLVSYIITKSITSCARSQRFTSPTCRYIREYTDWPGRRKFNWKLFGNEVCKIDVGPSLKHDNRSQILQMEFPGNFTRLTLARSRGKTPDLHHFRRNLIKLKSNLKQLNPNLNLVFTWINFQFICLKMVFSLIKLRLKWCKGFRSWKEGHWSFVKILRF